jgi:multiple sugar transport system permease protein
MHESSRFRWVRRVVLTVLTLFVGFPLYVMITTSVQPLADVSRSFRWIPRHVTLRPYSDAWSAIPLGHYLANSAIVAGASALLAVMVAAPAAYALARFRFHGRSLFSTGLLSTQLMPGLFFLLPTFLLYAQFGRTTGVQLIGTYPALILIDLTFAVPFAVWLLSGWFASQPREAEEAAAVDGAGPISVFLRIALPPAVPAIAAVLVFAFGLSWSEVLFAAVLTDEHTETVAVGLPALTGSPTPLWNDLMAAAIISALPVVLAWIVTAPILNRVVRASSA